MRGRRFNALVISLMAGAGFVTGLFTDLVGLVHQLVEWPARRRVRLAVERETARRIGELVPAQRAGAVPAWWEFVPAPWYPVGETAVIPAQRDGGR